MNVHVRVRYSVKYYDNGSEVTSIDTNDLEEAEIQCYQLKQNGTDAHIWDNIYNESLEQ